MKHVLALGLMLFSTLFSISARSAQMDLGGQIAAGKQLFESTCSASTCHGSGGVGAGGPKLVDRNFSLDVVQTTVNEGRAGTPMAGFKDVFEADQIASIVAYVLSISTGGRWATVIPVIDKRASAPWPRIPIDGEESFPSKGQDLFYDATRMTACRTCHSHRENGGPVGNDLSALTSSPSELLAKLAKPMTMEVVTLTTAKGKVMGLLKSDTGDVIKLVDISSLPPVVRSVRATDVTARATADVPFDHAALGYTPQELRDAAGFLSVGK
jgi:mono/diheme cytochrome c family protein